MSTVAAEHELYYACRLIFGPGLNLSREFLEYLQPDGIKRAYRKKALETHPDRFAAGTASLLRNGQLFISVQQAYEKLTHYLAAREDGYTFPASAPTPAAAWPSRPSAGNPAQNHSFSRPEGGPAPFSAFTAGATAYGSKQASRKNTAGRAKAAANSNKQPFNITELYNGPIPGRRLMLGHFLYYCGKTNWKTIAQALIWQRSQRPLMGEICRRSGLLTPQETRQILCNRELMEPFGRTAVKLGLLSELQIESMLWRQKILQKKIGAYFIENNLLTPQELQALLKKHHQHNSGFMPPASMAGFPH